MPLPFAEVVRLTGPERARLEALVRAGSTPQALVFRCRIILRAAAEDHPTNLQLAAEFHCNRHTVGAWRNRYLQHGLARLAIQHAVFAVITSFQREQATEPWRL